jgi:hypothetical protein
VSAVSLCAVPAVGVVSPVVAHADTAGATSEARADAQKAEQTGQRVEITGEDTEYSTTYADPDGSTFDLVQSAVPVRVKGADGQWTAPDATLVRNADGSVGPKAALAQVSFSGGGDGSGLVRMARDGRSLRLGWPGSLPEPSLDGDSAVYADVLPGVDLRMTATVEGFSEVLVVKTPQAAANPDLQKIRFSMASAGVNVEQTTAGGMVGLDADADTVFSAPPALMWNSAQEDAAGQPASQALPRSLAAAGDDSGGDPGSDGSGASVPDPARGPAAGAAQAVLPVSVGDGSLSVTPEASMLSDTDASDYPLYIDPNVSWNETTRTLLRSDGYTDYGFGNGSDDEGSGVGHCSSYGGYYCGPGYTQRLYFQFSPDELKGKQVLSATFRVTETWSFTCDAQTVDLERTNNISSSTTWSSKPKNLDLMVDRTVSAGRGSACSPSQPEANIEFTDNPDESNEDLTPTVEKFAAGDFSKLTLALIAHDESDTAAWKRFKNDAELDVSFVGIPAVPKSVGVVTGDGQVCEGNADDPQVIGDPTPSLTATPRTVSGGGSGADLRAAFDVDKLGSDGTWSNTQDFAERPSTSYADNGATQTISWPTTLADGGHYRYRSWTESFYDGDSKYLSGPSNATQSHWCYFTVDSTAPKAPVITPDSHYPECTTNDCPAGGGPGVNGTFTATHNPADSNIVSFEYKWSGDATWSSPLSGSTVSIPFTPQHSGTYTLYVRAKDNVSSHSWGAQATFQVLVAAGDGPVGQWHFDEASGAAKDSSAEQAHDATLSAAGASRDGRGRLGTVTVDAQGDPVTDPTPDTGLTLNGSTGYAATADPVVETRSSYTVSAWARLEAVPSHAAVVLNQIGGNSSGFELYYSTTYSKWVFNWHWQDSGGTTQYARSFADATSPPLKVWTHLAGVYDSDAGTIQLFVNGRPQGTPVALPAGQPTDGDGPLQFGRGGTSTTSYTDYFQGQIDEVRAWQRALTGDEVADDAALKTNDDYAATELVASWQPAGATGTTLPDTTSGYGTALSLTSSGATLDGQALTLDGSTGAATAPGPLVDDTGSFTVSTTVQLDSSALAGKPVGYTAQVLGQRTAGGSSWGLWYEKTGSETTLDDNGDLIQQPTGFWRFGRLDADGTFTAVSSDEEAVMDDAVSLTGVYDAQGDDGAGTVSLYLDADQNGGGPLDYTATAGSGNFAVGEGYAAGDTGWSHHLPGSITGIRLWAGAMASSDQIDTVVDDSDDG